MYINIFKAARQGKLLVTKDGVRILGRTYSQGDKVKFRVNMNRMSLKKLLQKGLLEISGQVKTKEEVLEDEFNEGVDEFGKIEATEKFNEPESEGNSEGGSDGSEIESSEENGEGTEGQGTEGASIIEEPNDATGLEETVVESSEEPEINQGNSEEIEESAEDLLEGSEIEIEESLIIPSKEELDSMTLSEIRVIANPLDLYSNSKEKLIDKLLAL